jgi:hypothetical protein
MINLRAKLGVLSQRWLLRLSCYLSLIGLSIMTLSIFVPRPLPVIAAMSIGQVFAGLGLLCFALSILTEIATRPPRSLAPPPPPRPDEDEGESSD